MCESVIASWLGVRPVKAAAEVWCPGRRCVGVLMVSGTD